MSAKGLLLRNLTHFLLLLVMLCGCTLAQTINDGSIPPVERTDPAQATLTPFLPGSEETEPPAPPETTFTPKPDSVSIFVPDYLADWSAWLAEDRFFQIMPTQDDAECFLTSGEAQILLGETVYALSDAFDTVTDGFSGDEMRALLRGETLAGAGDEAVNLILPRRTAEMLGNSFTVSESVAQDVRGDTLAEMLYENPGVITLIPFELLTPAVKVLEIDGVSPYDQDFDPAGYMLTIPIGINCADEAITGLVTPHLPGWRTNRDPQKFSSILLTGTTALVRATAGKMETLGMEYPGLMIKNWFDQADISHISNEASFSELCPPANPYQTDLLFCSRPEYVELLTFLGVDVVELSGNHLADKGVPLLLDAFRILEENGIPYYAAGMNPAEAEQPALFSHNGNKIAFLGCNDAGPTFVWVTETRPGVLRCDFDRMAELVQQLRGEGYLPVVTYQYWETFQFDAMPYQRNHSYQMIDAGAVLVSGSQSHVPMSMDYYRGGFIHYGLGNLFFDQMDRPVVGTRREFLDRHIFYDGKYLGVQLLTAMLEDYAQPRPMTEEERQDLLRDAFRYFRYLP